MNYLNDELISILGRVKYSDGSGEKEIKWE